jgi:hypothetical protein
MSYPDENKELRIICLFMYVNAEFFAEPFLNQDKFGKWAKAQQEMIEFSAQLHQALETSKPVFHEQISKLKNYREAIIGKPVPISGEASKQNCLLTGNLNPLFEVLKSNPMLVQAIKTHIISELFDNWYKTQSKEIQSLRESLGREYFKEFELLATSLDRDCANYQAKKLKAINNFDLPKGVRISGISQRNDEIGQQKPTQITIENPLNVDVSELQLLVDKYNTAQELRETLKNPERSILMRLNDFSNKIHNQSIADKLTANNDSDGIRLLKTVGYALSTVLFGLGFYLSYKYKGTWKFWTSDDNEILENSKENIDTNFISLSNIK